MVEYEYYLRFIFSVFFICRFCWSGILMCSTQQRQNGFLSIHFFLHNLHRRFKRQNKKEDEKGASKILYNRQKKPKRVHSWQLSYLIFAQENGNTSTIHNMGESVYSWLPLHSHQHPSRQHHGCWKKRTR